MADLAKPTQKELNSTNGSPVLPHREVDVQSLHGTAFRVQQFRNGDLLPCGGSIWTDTLSHRLCLDLDEVEPRLAKVTVISRTDDLVLHSESIRKTSYPSCEAKLFSMIRGFTEWVHKAGLRAQPDQMWNRNKRYLTGESCPNLSEMLQSKLAACVELSALAHHYLKMNQIDSWYMSGVSMEDTDSSHEHHAWVEIRVEGRELIWDVANPHGRRYSDGSTCIMPRLIELAPGSFTLLTEAQKATLISGTPMLQDSQSKLYYGVHSCEDGDFEFALIDRQLC